MNGVLKKTRVVTHRQEMAQLHRGWHLRVAYRRNLVWPYDHPETTSPSILEGGDIALCCPLPGHRSTARIGTLTHGLAPCLVGQQSRDLAADGSGVTERNQDAASVGEQLARVPIGCRDDRLAEPEAVGQRARRHLRLVKIRRDVDVT